MKRPISLARCWSGSVCCLVLALAACTHDTAPVATQSGYPIPHVSAVMDVSGPGCSDRTHPSGLLIDRVETPPAWGIAVRDDDPQLLTGAVGWLHARTVQEIAAGDHAVFVGEVLSIEQGPGRGALVYLHRAYHGL